MHQFISLQLEFPFLPPWHKFEEVPVSYLQYAPHDACVLHEPIKEIKLTSRNMRFKECLTLFLRASA